jgi:hypothetical protein
MFVIGINFKIFALIADNNMLTDELARFTSSNLAFKSTFKFLSFEIESLQEDNSEV